MTLTAEMLIGNLIEGTLGASAFAREHYLLRESLHSLVRLARAEQLREIRMNVKTLIGVQGEAALRSEDKFTNLGCGENCSQCIQRELEFDYPDTLNSNQIAGQK